MHYLTEKGWLSSTHIALPQGSLQYQKSKPEDMGILGLKGAPTLAWGEQSPQAKLEASSRIRQMLKA